MSTAEEARKLVSFAKFPVPKAQQAPDHTGVAKNSAEQKSVLKGHVNLYKVYR